MNAALPSPEAILARPRLCLVGGRRGLAQSAHRKAAIIALLMWFFMNEVPTESTGSSNDLVEVAAVSMVATTATSEFAELIAPQRKPYRHRPSLHIFSRCEHAVPDV